MTFSELIRRVIAARKSPVAQLLIVLSAVAVAAAIRLFTDRGAHGMPFLTFVPVVVLAAIFLEWPYAVIAALVSLMAIVSLFGADPRIQFTLPNYFLWGAFAAVTVFIMATGHILRQTILELDAQSAKVRSFNAELAHRIKNTLQIVRALASRAAQSTDPVEFYDTLAGRLDALAKANDLLVSGTLEECDIEDLVRAAMQPFSTRAIGIGGPKCTIAGDVGVQLMMALHELATNAVKYGALSSEQGRVVIDWTRGDGTLELVWRECDGPLVTPPTRRGLGSRMLTAGGRLKTVDLDFRPEGVICRVTVAAPC